MLTCIAIIALFVGTCHGYSSGAHISACNPNAEKFLFPSGHGVEPQPIETSPYDVAAIPRRRAVGIFDIKVHHDSLKKNSFVLKHCRCPLLRGGVDIKYVAGKRSKILRTKSLLGHEKYIASI